MKQEYIKKKGEKTTFHLRDRMIKIGRLEKSGDCWNAEDSINNFYLKLAFQLRFVPKTPCLDR